MPAIAVRRDRKKADGSIGFIGRPHKLSLHFRPPLTHHQVTPTPSPVNSPPGQYQPQRETAHHKFARNFLSKRCIFQLSVLAPLVGTILLFIGLVQLTPGAEASSFGIPLIVAGAGAFILGLVVITIRMYFKWELNRLNSRRTDLPQIKVNEPSCTDTDVEKALQNENSGEGGLPGITTNMINNDIGKQQARPDTIQEEGDKDKFQGDGTDETSKLLIERRDTGGSESNLYNKGESTNGNGPNVNKINAATTAESENKTRRSSCIGGGGSKGNNKNV
jgi:hypothetical protein